MDPSAQELATFDTLAKVLGWIGFEDEGDRTTWSSFCVALGKPKLVRQIGAIPLAAYEKVVTNWRVKDKQNGQDIVEEPSAVELGHAGLLRRVSRLLLKLPPDETGAPTPQAAAGSMASMASLVTALQANQNGTNNNGKILMSKVLDQGDDTEVKPMDPQVHEKLIADWTSRENDGEEPLEEEEASMAQMAALETRVKNGGLPQVDFGVWRPFGDRLARALKFTVHTLRPDGSVAMKEINGPGDFTAWAKSWRVFAFAMSALNYASRTRLDRYYNRIAKLNEEFPNHWWVVGLADIRMRSEHMERVKRNCVKRHTNGELADYDPLRPWDVVFREAALDKDFWNQEVDKKILLHALAMTTHTKLVDEGYGALEEAPPALKSSGGGKAGGKKKKRAASSSSEEAGRKRRKRGRGTGNPKGDPKGSKKGAGKGNGKQKNNSPTQQDANGKYIRFNGSQVCWAYNKTLNGCSPTCPSMRAHVCEICTGLHRAVECPTPKA